MWLLRSGRPPAVAAELAGVGKRTVERWLSWYRRSGLKEVLKRVPGHGAPGSACRLGGEQLEELVARAGEGQFRTYSEARDWVEEEWGVSYEYKGTYALLARLSVRPKVPRPAAQKADPRCAGGVDKGGLTVALAEAGLRSGEEVYTSDEMRLGLRGGGAAGVGA